MAVDERADTLLVDCHVLIGDSLGRAVAVRRGDGDRLRQDCGVEHGLVRERPHPTDRSSASRRRSCAGGRRPRAAWTRPPRGSVVAVGVAGVLDRVLKSVAKPLVERVVLLAKGVQILVDGREVVTRQLLTCQIVDDRRCEVR